MNVVIWPVGLQPQKKIAKRPSYRQIEWDVSWLGFGPVGFFYTLWK
jgi:hypothetical protein